MTLIKARKKNKSSWNDEIWLYFEIDEILYSRLHIAMWYDMRWLHDMIWDEMIWYDIMWCGMIWYDMILCDVVWYDMI